MKVRGVQFDSKPEFNLWRTKGMRLLASTLVVGLLSGFEACERKTTFDQAAWEDNFDKISSFAPIDIVFQLDTSLSMLSILNAVQLQFASFANTYLDSNNPASLVDVNIFNAPMDGFWESPIYLNHARPGKANFQKILSTIDPATGQRKNSAQLEDEFNSFIATMISHMNGHFMSRPIQSLQTSLIQQIRNQSAGIRQGSTRIFLPITDSDDNGSARFRGPDYAFYDLIQPVSLNFKYLHAVTQTSGPIATFFQSLGQTGYPMLIPVVSLENSIPQSQGAALVYQKQPPEQTRGDLDQLLRIIDRSTSNTDPRWAMKVLAPINQLSVASLRGSWNWGCEKSNSPSVITARFLSGTTFVPEENLFATPATYLKSTIEAIQSQSGSAFSRLSTFDDVCDVINAPNGLSNLFSGIGEILQSYNAKIELRQAFQIDRPVVIRVSNAEGQLTQELTVDPSGQVSPFTFDPANRREIFINSNYIKDHPGLRLKVLYFPDFSQSEGQSQ